MYKYSLVRGKIYYHELKQLLPSVANLLAFLLSILYLAISASILTALISLSVIADINTSIEQRIIYQLGYSVLLYFLIRIQKSAILGLNYEHYLASLPAPKILKHTNTVILTVVAGNLPLLAPLFLLMFTPSLSIFINQLHFPIFALSILIVALISLKNKTFPWLSFVFTPLVFVFCVEEGSVSPMSINSIWLFIMVVEAYYEPLSFITDKSLRIKRYWQIRWIAIIKKPASILTRIFLSGLFIGMAAYVQNKMGQVANDYLQVLFIWVLSILIGSYQFDNEKFYLHYQYYLNGLLNRAGLRYCLDISPAICITLISCIALYLWLHFSLNLIVLLPLEVLVTIICVSKFHRNFFIIPSLLSGFLLYIQ
ncbi:MAG: hypothetical protein HRT54_17280 [Colwellia sp.]|nr:hypothetical protein [Colwellia sp.]